MEALRCESPHQRKLESVQIPEALLTEHVDDPFVVRRKQAYGVFKQQHEGCVDHAVGQLVGVGLKEEQRRKGEAKEARVPTDAPRCSPALLPGNPAARPAGSELLAGS